ncbi:MAG: hypothetical protein NW218_16645 [Saprospiraceae bacterium]|nr:hypothetical protein [Saprospiraceae bacterium]
MIDFLSHLGYSKNFFKVESFDGHGLPKIVEVSFDGSKSKERILKVFKGSINSKEEMMAVLQQLPDYDGLYSIVNIEMDLEWILSCANKLISFVYIGRIKNIDYISKFTKLRYLSLKGCKQPLDLSKLNQLIEISVEQVDFLGFKFSPLANIRHFRFVNCRNISSIPINKNTPLQYLSVLWDRDTKSFDFLKEAANLEIIGLFRVSQLEHWPDSSQMTRLRRIYFADTNRFFDFSGLAKAPNLECINFGINGIKPVHLEPFLACKSLKYLRYSGTKKDNALVREMFPGVLMDDDDQPEDCSGTSVRFSEDDWVMR